MRSSNSPTASCLTRGSFCVAEQVYAPGGLPGHFNNEDTAAWPSWPLAIELARVASNTTTPAVLVIGGLDSSGGAGLSRDVRTLTELGVGALCVATAVTAQTGSLSELDFDAGSGRFEVTVSPGPQQVVEGPGADPVRHAVVILQER